MTWCAAPLAMALAVTVTDTPLPRLTHAEGVVAADSTGVRTGAGRAEIALADGSIVHVDTSTFVAYPNDAALRLDDGRVVLRAKTGFDIETPGARLDLEPGTVAIVIADRRPGRLLVSVPVGVVTLRTGYASITRVVAGQSAMMTSAASVPWATAYTRVQLDAFTLWSDARAASTGVGVAAADWAASDLSGTTVGATPPCTGYPSWSAPCWVMPAPSPSRHRPGQPLPRPSSAPNFAPNYAPHFETRPAAPDPPPPAEPATRQARPTPPPGTSPAPSAPPPARGHGGAARVPERPPSP